MTHSEPYARWASGEKLHAHILLKDFSYAKFCDEGYASECDIEILKLVLRKLTVRNIKLMLQSMNEGNFEYHNFSDAYLMRVSSAIKDKINSVERTNLYTDLGGWAILKPIKGLDKKPTQYVVNYSADGWYTIAAPNADNVVSVKVMYGGKYLNPIIVGVKNKALGIDICDTNYDHRADKKMLAYNTYDDVYMFLEYLCPVVYKGIGMKSLVTEADFERFTTKVNERKMAFVHQFYNSLLASNDNLKKIRKTYFYSLPQHLVAMADSQIAKKDYSTEMFLPCSYSEFAKGGCEVTYLGKDWYQVTAPKSGGKSLRLKVVLYGPKLRPAIMGIRNPNHSVDYCPGRFE